METKCIPPFAALSNAIPIWGTNLITIILIEFHPTDRVIDIRSQGFRLLQARDSASANLSFVSRCRPILMMVAKRLRLRYFEAKSPELDIVVNLRSKHDFIMTPEIKSVDSKRYSPGVPIQNRPE